VNSVAIIGAGITGLTAGFYLQRQGIPVVIYESSNRAGGVIRSIRDKGYLAEFGPNTILESSPKVTALVRDAGLDERKLPSHPKAEARYLVRYHRPIRMPGSPLGFLTTDLFSAKAKVAVLREPFIPRRMNQYEESVAEFVIRRLGKEFLDHAIDALVAGVYAGDPSKLSVSQALPKLAQLEEKYGSLIKGQILGARERRKRAEIAKDRAPKFSFDEGLQTLTDALSQNLGDSLRVDSTVLKVSQTLDGWSVKVREPGGENSYEHSAVLYAGTAFGLAELKLETDAAPDLKIFSNIRYAPVASVVLGFKREDVAHPCQGFGMLIPKVEGFKILGTIFSSSLFPNRAPAGHVLLTCYIGGERYPELAGSSHQELVNMALEDMRVLLGVRGKPEFEHTFFYPRAIPQYNVGYGQYRRLMNEIETGNRGFFLAGHYRDGVSLSDSIVCGCTAAERLSNYCAIPSGIGKSHNMV
jgi:oxygen-dependent protoporphyrinogen oxidase